MFIARHRSFIYFYCCWSIWVAYYIWINVIYGWPAAVCPSDHRVWQKFCHRILLANFSVNFFCTCHAYGHHWHLPLIPLSVTLTLAGITRPAQSKTSWLYFLHTFQLTGMEFDVMLKQFKLNILMLLLSEIFVIKGNICWFPDCIKKI